MPRISNIRGSISWSRVPCGHGRGRGPWPVVWPERREPGLHTLDPLLCLFAGVGCVISSIFGLRVAHLECGDQRVHHVREARGKLCGMARLELRGSPEPCAFKDAAECGRERRTDAGAGDTGTRKRAEQQVRRERERKERRRIKEPQPQKPQTPVPSPDARRQTPRRRQTPDPDARRQSW